MWTSVPSNVHTPPWTPSQSRIARSAIMSRTCCTSPGEVRITRRISLVAACCSSASARPRSRSPPPAPLPPGAGWRARDADRAAIFRGAAFRRAGFLLLNWWPCSARAVGGEERAHLAVEPPRALEVGRVPGRLDPHEGRARHGLVHLLGQL